MTVIRQTNTGRDVLFDDDAPVLERINGATLKYTPNVGRFGSVYFVEGKSIQHVGRLVLGLERLPDPHKWEVLPLRGPFDLRKDSLRINIRERHGRRPPPDLAQYHPKGRDHMRQVVLSPGSYGEPPAMTEPQLETWIAQHRRTA